VSASLTSACSAMLWQRAAAAGSTAVSSAATARQPLVWNSGGGPRPLPPRSRDAAGRPPPPPALPGCGEPPLPPPRVAPREGPPPGPGLRVPGSARRPDDPYGSGVVLARRLGPRDGVSLPSSDVWCSCWSCGGL